MSRLVSELLYASMAYLDAYEPGTPVTRRLLEREIADTARARYGGHEYESLGGGPKGSIAASRAMIKALDNWVNDHTHFVTEGESLALWHLVAEMTPSVAEMVEVIRCAASWAIGYGDYSVHDPWNRTLPEPNFI